ncbi:hypothetical protein E2C01_060158 [Portunus trituberculatus]|uniref:Uncharacterized protein n=1 Tax=Portunus trituberculatus TaxID=210409 RepID=A0A5B7H8J0_PORTR|nr:hypothetical protein [Portunus trituberculatus]
MLFIFILLEEYLKAVWCGRAEGASRPSFSSTSASAAGLSFTADVCSVQGHQEAGKREQRLPVH